MNEKNKLSFWEEEAIKLDGCLHLIFTKTAKFEMGELEIKNLVHRNTFLVQKNRDGFELYTEKYRILCIIDDESGLIKVTKTFDKVKYYVRNKIMRSGIPMEPESVMVTIDNRTYGLGIIYDNIDPVDREKIKELEDNAREYNKVFMSILDLETAKLNEDDEDIEYKPSAKLERLLKTAEAYANLECDLAEKEAQLYGRIPYSRIETLDYDRNDRTAYAFIVSDLDEKKIKAFAEGTNVQIETGDGEFDFLRAEVIKVFKEETDNQEPYLGLLFQGQVGIDTFPSNGWITKSFSTVMRDVQLKSIENIRKHKSPAIYMDAVFSKDELAGFENKDLSELEDNLRKQKYPPKESQMIAIKKGIDSKDIYLVMGPPGTGKTTVILEWVKYFVKNEHLRVLVSSQNNKAVDNVLARLCEDKDIDIIRIGSEAKVQSDVVQFLFENKVSHLQNQIANKTGQVILNVQNIKNEWEKLLEQSESVKDKLEKLNKADSILENKLEDLTLVRNSLIDAYRKYQEISTKARNCEVLVKERYEKLKSYPSKGIMGIWGKFMRWMGKSSMCEIVAEYDELNAAEKKAVYLYNNVHDNYVKTCNDVYTLSYLPRQQADGAYNKSYKELSSFVAKTKKIDNHKWKIELYDIPPIYSPEILSYSDKINSGLKHISSFLEHLENWRSKNLNTKTHSLEQMILDSANIVGATCIGVSSQQRFADIKYDVTIIDEAGQIQVHNALVPMSLSSKLIMLGDHKQIPPSVNEDLVQACDENGVKTDLLGHSLFEYMYKDVVPDSNKILLDTQFRMPPEVAEIISKRFYDHKYVSIPGFKDDVASQIPTLSSARMVVIDTSEEMTRLEAKDENNGTYNKLEADIIKKIMCQIMMQEGFDINSVGIISAYKAQVKQIRNCLNDILEEQQANDIVATLDSFQGQERDVILYSFTRSSMKDPNKKRIGFLNELRRLNVAITRCKKMIVLIGDMKFLSECNYEDPVEDGQDESEVFERSERNFSEFIREMMEGIRNGNEGFRAGEVISYSEFYQRLS